tara:strand:+ start:2005 stop:2259 length:255 start_codon:yes stop_codon:yes gene_type:complete
MAPKSLERLVKGARKAAGGAKRVGRAAGGAVKAIKDRDLKKLKKKAIQGSKGVKKLVKGGSQVKKAGMKQVKGAKKLKAEFLGS